MSKLSTSAGQVLLGLALPLVSTLAMAQSNTTDLGRVDVSGSATASMVKFNVSQACPQIGAELQESLQGLVWRYGEISPTRVDFTLAGNQIIEVKTGHSGAVAAAPIKRAVKKDQPLTWDDIEIPANRMTELWEKQKSLVGLK